LTTEPRLFLTNGSEVKAASTSGDAGRSEALSLLVIDEAAHVDGLEELWTGLYPTLSTGGRCIALSTPNGVGNWFHKTYIEAEQNRMISTRLTTMGCPPRERSRMV
jgi:phage FluMu gp28-like protein